MLIALVLAIVAIHVQQQLLRHRAEQLLSDIRALDLRVSTYADAQKIFQRWATWAHYVGSCSEKRCEFDVSLNDFQARHVDAFAERLWLQKVYAILGGRPAVINASVTVRNAFVWGKSFWLAVDVPPTDDPNEKFGGHGYTLIGDSRSVSRFLPDSWQLLLHSNYMVSRPSACTGCIVVHAKFSPYAESSDVRRLMVFNLACLTQWKPCREEGDLMPSAWSQYLEEAASFDAVWRDYRACTPARLPILGRDANHVALVEVAGKPNTKLSSDDFQDLSMRLLKRLKHSEFWEPGTIREARVFRSAVATPTDSVVELNPSHRYVILFRYYETPAVELRECGVMPATPENLELVLHGISQDFLSSEPLEPPPHLD